MNFKWKKIGMRVEASFWNKNESALKRESVTVERWARVQDKVSIAVSRAFPRLPLNRAPAVTRASHTRAGAVRPGCGARGT
jgi:hypothetical protein